MEDRELLQRHVDEQLQQIAELRSQLDDMKVVACDDAVDAEEGEVRRLSMKLDETLDVVDAKNKQVWTLDSTSAFCPSNC